MLHVNHTLEDVEGHRHLSMSHLGFGHLLHLRVRSREERDEEVEKHDDHNR